MTKTKWKKLLTEKDEPLHMTCEENDAYDGVVWAFKTVSIHDSLLGHAKMKFDYEILEDPNGKTDFATVEEKMEFENFLGDCLLHLVEETNANRNDNPEEPSEQG